MTTGSDTSIPEVGVGRVVPTGLGSPKGPGPDKLSPPIGSIPRAGHVSLPWSLNLGAAHPSVKGLRWAEISTLGDFPIVRDYLTEGDARLIASAPDMRDLLCAGSFCLTPQERVRWIERVRTLLSNLDGAK